MNDPEGRERVDIFIHNGTLRNLQYNTINKTEYILSLVISFGRCIKFFQKYAPN